VCSTARIGRGHSGQGMSDCARRIDAAPSQLALVARCPALGLDARSGQADHGVGVGNQAGVQFVADRVPGNFGPRTRLVAYQHPDVITGGNQRPPQSGAEKSGGTGDDDLHDRQIMRVRVNVRSCRSRGVA